MNPTFDKWIPAQLFSGQVNHSAPADSCGAGDCQILDFEQHPHFVAQFDSLSVCETKHHVIIQHGIHVFDPQRVHGTVENHPFQITRL